LVEELLALAPKVRWHFEENLATKDFLALPVEAQAMGAHIVSAYSINIDQGHHSAELALPTQTAKDSDNKVFITNQTHAKKITRCCHPHVKFPRHNVIQCSGRSTLSYT